MVELPLGRKGSTMLGLDLGEMEWMDRAACKDADPHLFFPDTKQEGSSEDAVFSYKQAKAICKGCSVTTECLAYALLMFPTAEVDFGMWGGTSPRERKGYRRGMKAVA